MQLIITIPDNKLQEAVIAVCATTGVTPTAANAKAILIKFITDAMTDKKRSDFIKSATINIPKPDDNSDIT